jgi:Flp pilus assembly pilin Flp
MQIIKSFIREEEGGEIAEYALLIVILALGLLAAMPALKDSLEAAFGNTSSHVQANADELGSAAPAE